MLESAIALVVSYIVGSIPFGFIVGKVVKRIDIREYGSGNIGATNVLRTLGPVWGAIVMLLDVLKGLGPVILCKHIGGPNLVVFGGLLAVFGHTFSVFLKFRGGKGVATSLGVIIGLDPVIAAIAFGGWAALTLITKYVSIASIIAATSVPLQMIFWSAREVPFAYKLLACVAALAIDLKHIPNIKRLIAGTESRIGQKVKVE